MYGIDISNWQKGIDLSNGNFDFAIMKATEGIHYVDPMLKTFSVQLTKLNKHMGFYHFARPDLHSTGPDMEKEAIFFYETLKAHGLIGKGILCLDWEKEPMNKPDLMRAWLEKIVELTGIIPFVYSSKSQFQSWCNKSEWSFIEGYHVWLAQWPSIKQYQSGIDPKISIQWYPPWGWDIWQFTSNGRVGNNNMRVDLNVSYMTAKEWETMSHSVEEYLSGDMQWAISQGLFIGYDDGTYRPTQPITREQLATVLRRFSNV